MARGISIVRQVFNDFSEDDAMTAAAAVAFYSALSFAPLLLLVSWIASFLGPDVQTAVIDSIRKVIGGEAASVVDRVLQHAKMPGGANAAGIFGLVALVLSAAGVFAQLQVAMNRVWGVRAKPGGGFMDWLRKRLLSIGMVLTILFLLLVSFAVSALLETLRSGNQDLWRGIELGVSLGLYVLLFAAMFRVLPDVQIAWRDVWVGAVITAVLFALGKWLIGIHLARSDVGEAYGAAGSLVLLLVWVYYSSIIVFFGAEITQAMARKLGSEIVPDRHAEWLHHPRPLEVP